MTAIQTHANSIQPNYPDPQATPQQPSVAFGQPSHGTATAVKALEDVAHGVKVTVEEVFAWAEEKVEKLGAQKDDAGPYTSHATIAPSDLDPIGSGLLAAVPQQERKSAHVSGRKQGNEMENEAEKGDDNK